MGTLLMGQIFTLTEDVLAVARGAFDDIITELGRVCRFYYAPRMERCSNCVIDPIGKKSSNIWINGGPAPFPMGSQCPMCNGQGMIAIELYDDVKVLIQEDITKFQKIGNMNFPDGSIQTKGFMTDLPIIQRASYMLKHIDLKDVLPQKYQLASEPICPGNIVQSRYFICVWKRIA